MGKMTLKSNFGVFSMKDVDGRKGQYWGRKRNIPVFVRKGRQCAVQKTALNPEISVDDTEVLKL